MKWFPTNVPPACVKGVPAAITDLKAARKTLEGLRPYSELPSSMRPIDYSTYVCYAVNGNEEVIQWVAEQLGDACTLYCWISEEHTLSKDWERVQRIHDAHCTEMLDARIQWIDWMIQTLEVMEMLQEESK